MTSIADRRRGVTAAVERVVALETGAAALERAVRLLEESFEHYRWVGVYLVEGDEIVLGPWRGPEPVLDERIPLGTGARGVAAWSGRTIVVDDTTEHRHAGAGFAWARSEIVVPISTPGAIVGAIVIVSDDVSTFGPDDRAWLEETARILSSALA